MNADTNPAGRILGNRDNFLAISKFPREGYPAINNSRGDNFLAIAAATISAGRGRGKDMKGVGPRNGRQNIGPAASPGKGRAVRVKNKFERVSSKCQVCGLKTLPNTRQTDGQYNAMGHRAPFFSCVSDRAVYGQ